MKWMARSYQMEWNPSGDNTWFRTIHISQVPEHLIRLRDKQRYFWNWIPIASAIHRWYYHKEWLKWERENNIGAIRH